jgi:hypothetical protein
MTTASTVLGAGAPIGNELAKILAVRNRPFRLVSRNPRPVAGGALFQADLADREQTIQAVAGSTDLHLLAGLRVQSCGLAGPDGARVADSYKGPWI